MDPTEASSRWQRWTVSGTESAVSNVLSGLDANLPLGWKRLRGNDVLRFQPLAAQDAALYALDTTPSPLEVTLGLRRVGDRELRGGWVWFTGQPNVIALPSALYGWGQVMRFLDDGIVPAARAVGAEVRIPNSEEVFLTELPAEVRDRLRSFSQAGCKSLPLSRPQTDLWHEFVIAAYRANAVLDARQFTDWLMAEGWSKKSAAELNVRFLDQCLLLSRYADEGTAA
jgi:hypothetical protein